MTTFLIIVALLLVWYLGVHNVLWWLRRKYPVIWIALYDAIEKDKADREKWEE